MQEKLKIFILLLFSFFNFILQKQILASVVSDVSTATDTINLSQETKLYMPSAYTAECIKRNEGHCFPRTSLFLITQNRKYDFSNLIHRWDNSDFIYFIKIDKNKYFTDLDGDGNSEIAIFPMVAGNNPVTSALIFKVKDNKLIHYGVGDFYWEKGEHVINIKKGKQWK